MENQESARDLPQSPAEEVARGGSNFLLYNLFDTISQASSEVSWRFRSNRSVDALHAALPEEQLRMWSQRYRCPPRAASLENLPRLRTMKPEVADRELAFVMQAGELALEKPRFPSKRKCQDLRWLILLGFVLAFVAMYCVLVFQQAELDVIQQLLHNGMLIASSAGCLAGMVLSTLFMLMTRCFPNFMVRLLVLGSPIVMIVSGSVYTTFHCMTAGCVFLAVGITLLMVLFFGCQQSGLTGQTMGQVLHDLVCPRTLLVHGLHLLLNLAWLVCCSLVVLAADIRFKDMAVEIVLAHIVVALIYVWGAEVLGYVAQVAYCGLLLRSYLGEDTRAFRRSLRTAFVVVGSACYAATVGAPGCLWSILRQAEARRRGKCRDEGQLSSAVPCPGRTVEYCGAWAIAVSAMRDVNHIEGARLAKCFLTCANAEVLLEDIMLKSIDFFGSLLCGLLGCAASVGTALFFELEQGSISWCGIIGFVSSFVFGRASMGFITHSVEAFLLLWSEDPGPFQHTELHKEFEMRISADLSYEFGVRPTPAPL